jgi:hypothetical protein
MMWIRYVIGFAWGGVRVLVAAVMCMPDWVACDCSQMPLWEDCLWKHRRNEHHDGVDGVNMFIGGYVVVVDGGVKWGGVIVTVLESIVCMDSHP